MPSYKVTRTGFMFGKLQMPGETIVTRTKFKKLPSWMELISDRVESAKHIKENNDMLEVIDGEQASPIGEIVEITN